MVRKKLTRNALVGEFMVAFLHVFVASRTAMNSYFFIHRWHALQLVRRSTFISPRTGFNSVCIREENGTPCQQQNCVRWCHHLSHVLPVDPTRRVQRVRLFLCSFVLYMPWIPGEHCRGICVECATAHLRWFEEDLGSEVVFWIEAPVSCQQLESDFWSQS